MDAVQRIFFLSLTAGCMMSLNGTIKDEVERKQSFKLFSSTNKAILTATGIGLGALAIGQWVVAPFCLSAAAGFASEAFVVENKDFKSYVMSKCTFLQKKSPPEFNPFMQGCLGDGTTFCVLSTLGGTLFSRFSGIPMTAGLMLGQTAGVAFHNKDFKDCLMYGWKKLRGEQNPVVPSPEQQKAVIARASGAALSWFCIAGLISKIPKIF